MRIIALALLLAGCGGDPRPLPGTYCQTSLACATSEGCSALEGGFCDEAGRCDFPVRPGCAADDECEAAAKCLCGLCVYLERPQRVEDQRPD